MACSDNVVRAGLTPKYIDVETLCKMLTYNCEEADRKRFQPIEVDSYTQLFSPPVPDFSVAKIQVFYRAFLTVLLSLNLNKNNNVCIF